MSGAEAAAPRAALAALEREAGLRYVESKLPRAAQLLHLVWPHCEAALAAQLSATTLAPAAAAEAAAVEELRRRTCAEAAALRNVEPLAAGLSSNPTALCVGGSGCLYVCTGARRAPCFETCAVQPHLRAACCETRGCTPRACTQCLL